MTTKPTETPRTDAESIRFNTADNFDDRHTVPADFARQLECELNEAIRCEAQLSSNIQSLKDRVASELGVDSTKPQLECWHLAAQVRTERDQLQNQNAELVHALRCANNSFFGSPDGQKQIDKALHHAK